MNVVAGYTDSLLGRSVVETAIAEARLRGAELHVLHFARIGIRSERPEVIGRYRTRMAEIESRLESEGIGGRGELVLVQKEPSDALLSELHELSADLLVIGSQARSAVGKFVLGSTAQHLLLRAECPVLVVRTPAEHGRASEG